MLHRVIITETVRKVEFIEAENQNEAIAKATEMYDQGEIDFMKEVNIEYEVQYVGEEKEEQ